METTMRKAKRKVAIHYRTGLRRPLKYLKMWGDPAWSRRLTRRLHIGMVDEELPVGQEGGRKSWYLALTQPENLAATLGPVRRVPKGHTLLLFEDDVVALTQYLHDVVGTLLLDEDGRPDGTERNVRRRPIEPPRPVAAPRRGGRRR
jgi:hypothetical protein